MIRHAFNLLSPSIQQALRSIVQWPWATSVLLLLLLLPAAQAQGDLGGTGAFNTSVLGALYGIGLAAVSIERFPVANLAWTNELWAKLVNMPSFGSHSGKRRSEVMQLRWFAGESWSAYDSPYPLFNGLGSHRVVVIGQNKPAGARGGAWVCVDEATARFISTREETPSQSRCGGYHYWASSPSWWLAIRLKSFTAEVDGKSLNRTGCREFTSTMDGATAQQGPAHDLPAKVEHLRYTPTMSHYARMDDPGYVDPEIYPTARALMRVMSHADEAIISTEEADDALGTVWNFLAPKDGRGGERELDRLAHLDSLFECPEPDFFFRLNLTRIAPSSAIMPHLVETAITLILPWFGITSLIIIEQVARKSIWSSLSTGSARFVHSSAYGGELTGIIKNPCTYVTIQGGPSSDLFWLISVFRLLFTLGSYVAAIWVQVALGINLPTRDDILSPSAARASGIAAAIVHVVTTVNVFALTRRAEHVFGASLAAVLVIVVVALEWSDIVSPSTIGPVILAAEFMSSVVQTTVSAAIHDAAPPEGWHHTVSALCAETRVAFILAAPRLVAWFQVGAKSSQG
jgi:hypothetical protein